LVRSTPSIFPMLLLAYLCMRAKDARARLKVFSNVAILVLGAAVMLSPWVIRNYRLTHTFVPGATVGGLALQGGQYTCRNLSFDTDFRTEVANSGIEREAVAAGLGLTIKDVLHSGPLFYSAGDEVAFNKALIQRATEQYLRHPGFLATCVGKNLLNFWFLGKTWSATALNALFQVPFLLIAAGGLCLLRRHGLLDRVAIVVTFLLSIVAIHLPVVAEARHSVPVCALLTIPAAVWIKWAWNKYARKQGRADVSIVAVGA
jgi:hypothetical protein